MTISTQTSTVTYLGNGVTTLFTFPFVGVNSADLQVVYTDANGTQNVLSTSQYTLVINPVPVGQLWGVGGSVTYPTSGTPIQTGTWITINRVVPFTQTISISNQGAFYPQAVEQALDLLELQIQQIETNSLYAFRAPVVDPTPPNILPPASLRANGYFGFDNFGQPMIFTTAPSTTTVTSASPRKITCTGASTQTLTAADSFGGVSIYQSSTPATIVQLPSGYGPYPIFDGNNNFGTYPVQILPPGGFTIQGATSYWMSWNGQSQSFYNDGTTILVL